ncbi:MAG: hypothetical protein ACU0DI_15250 [Paracoccaceae bacterium]
MAQRIILIHGRSTKPARRHHKKFQKIALLQGVARVNPAKAAKIGNQVGLNIVYYGHVNNRLLKDTPKHAAKLTATDPDLGTPCVPQAGFDLAINTLAGFKRFDKAKYREILRDNKDLEWLDDTASWLSTLASLISFNVANTLAVRFSTADLGAYLTDQDVGSEIRRELGGPLKRALLRGDDICLISHSMGCIVAYDVLWKFSRMSEHKNVQKSGNKITKWITVGCPLGEPGVKGNLFGSGKSGDQRYPANIVKDWLNIAAKDDFVAHDKTVKDDFRRMERSGLVDSITDWKKKFYNCYVKDGVSNPHKFYGYLAHNVTGQQIADWIR